MTRKNKGNRRIDGALLEPAQDFRGTFLRDETTDKNIMRILHEKAPAELTSLEPEESQIQQ